ncbi:hypothetical protein SAMN05216321_105386 [Cupriavidus sp. OV038]|jgi:hypothetical protein|uniref:T6SS immunity protein Tli4 family protein n=1 Tax=unclassified Cupriavidus TaxID=2640874 RepID=UPI0008EC0507|nr:MULTISPECIES: T6SS immunity protein Tli4 family protein [unclassified Cupriavidus]SFC62904.1 hypothetical protein SAMN05216321_105386 [Cupriavidus sp. OV038]SFP40062.1 hypothetical protein SAMN05216322_1063 [Cupriavidus sp. OV096]
MNLTRRFFTAGLCLTLAGCDFPPKMTAQEQQAIQALTTQLVPQCVGRYLIDMPAQVELGGMVKMQGALVETVAMSLDQFQKEVAAREAELTKTRSIDAHPFLYVNAPAWDEHSRYFLHRGSIGNDPGHRILEGYRWENGVLIRIELQSWDFTKPDQTKDPLVRKMETKNDVPRAATQVFEMLTSFRGRPDGAIPTEPGLCVPGGILLGKSKDDEQVDVDFNLPAYPDVYFNVFTHSSLQEKTSLLWRGGPIAAAQRVLDDGKTLRRGTVDLPGGRGEEMVIAGPMIVTNVQGQAFRLESNATTGSPETPFVAVKLSNGGPTGLEEPLKKASLTEAQALALWDAVSRTLRPRPGAL